MTERDPPRPPTSRPDVDEQAEAEVRFYLERKVEQLVAAGWAPEDAHIEALRRFGDAEGVKGDMRRMTKAREGRMGKTEWRDVLRQDLRSGLRQVARNPVFSTVAVLTLALGIGTDTAVFSVVDGIVFSPLPYQDADELVAVWLDATRRGGPVDEWPNYPSLHDLGERSRTLEAIGMWGDTRRTLSGRGEPEQVLGAVVSQPMFETVLPVEPALGRGFAVEDARPGAPGTVLLSYGFWQRAFGGDEGVVGGTITFNEEPYAVLGVMPRDFRPPFVERADFWSPLRWEMSDNGCGRGGYCIRSIARMADGVDFADAATEAAAIGDQLAAEYPETSVDQTFFLRPLRDDIVGPARTALLALLGAAGLVLLIVCVNVANLLLARGTVRQSELALRSALGAGRPRLTFQLLVESLVLAVTGGALGLALAYGLTELLVAVAPANTPRLGEVAVDGRVLTFAASASVLSGLIFGVLPALRSAGPNLHGWLRASGRGSDRAAGARTRSALVVIQVGLALVLLVSSGLFVRTFENLRALDLGFDPEGLLTLQVSLPNTRYADRASRQDFYPRLVERLATLPGVDAVGATSSLPLSFSNGDVDFYIEGRPVPPPGQVPAVWWRQVTPGYLAAMGTPILAGRGVLPSDVDDAPDVVVVNQTFARRFFPAGDAIGSRVSVDGPNPSGWREIVGVAQDVRHFGLRADSRAALYLPFDQMPSSFMFLVVRTDRELGQVASQARGTLAEMDPLVAAANVGPFQDLVRDAMGPDRLIVSLFSLFGALALILALVGLYGVVSYSVTTRLPEMGVRLAMGASAGAVGRLVVRRSLALVGVGLVLGVGAALAATHLMESLLFGVTAADPVTFLVVALLLTAASTLAAAIPAARAARVDPVRVLTAE